MNYATKNGRRRLVFDNSIEAISVVDELLAQFGPRWLAATVQSIAAANSDDTAAADFHRKAAYSSVDAAFAGAYARMPPDINEAWRAAEERGG